MQHCPKCQSRDVSRSRARTKVERWRKAITGKCLFRCPVCEWRGWGYDLGPKFDPRDIDAASGALAPEPPNLKDTVLARAPGPTALDLTELDSFSRD